MMRSHEYPRTPSKSQHDAVHRQSAHLDNEVLSNTPPRSRTWTSGHTLRPDSQYGPVSPHTPSSQYEDIAGVLESTSTGIRRTEGRRDLPSLAESMVIAVMGVTGSGKSSFISLLADQDVEVSHSLHSNTVNVKVYSFTDESGRTVFLLDTPGFDDTTRSDAEVLKDISYFLASMYANRVRLAGLIYLHRISDARMPGSAMKNLRMFKSLCGEPNYKHVALTTTMWSEMEINDEANVGHQRLLELERTYWADMILSGSTVKKHNGQRSSALEIVRTLTTRANSFITLAIQHQLVDEGRTLDKTDAGKVIYDEIETVKSRVERELAELQENLEEAEQDEDEQTIEYLRTELAAAEARATKRARDGDSLEVNIRQLAEEQQPWYHNLVSALQQQGHGGVRTSSPENEELEARVRDLELRFNAKDQGTESLKRQPQRHGRGNVAEAKRGKGQQFIFERRSRGEDRQQSLIIQLLAKIGIGVVLGGTRGKPEVVPNQTR